MSLDAARMKRIEERFVEAVARVPAEEDLLCGLVRRAKTAGLRRIVQRGSPLADEARDELQRRGEA